MIHLPGMPRLPLLVNIFNLYDLDEADRGRRDERAVRGVAWRGAEVDLQVLSLELPPDLVVELGLCPDPERTGQDPASTSRLSPVRIAIGSRTATVPPYRGAANKVVIGHTALLALGLKLHADGDLIDDPFPARWGPPLDAV